MPKVLDLDQMRRDSSFVNFKDLKETMIPTQKIELVRGKHEEFEAFGELNEYSSGTK